ncbi:MAG: hypothetical protein AB7P14_28325 [Blastocatellales bacterium]
MSNKDEIQSEILDLLRADEENVPVSIRLFNDTGILAQFDWLLSLLDKVIVEVERDCEERGIFPLLRMDASGIELWAYDFILRCHMLASARQQIAFAASHIFRTHVLEVSCHLRRAIEGAGIAFLSLSEPDLGNAYIEGRRSEITRRTQKDKIFPESNPITKDLRDSIDFANELTHNNFKSMAGRLEHAFGSSGSKWSFGIKLSYHEVGSPNHSHILRIALWTLRVGERIARLFAASFSLPEASLWYTELKDYSERLDALNVKLNSIVRPEGT